jgi:hypothetical protein
MSEGEERQLGTVRAVWRLFLNAMLATIRDFLPIMARKRKLMKTR